MEANVCFAVGTSGKSMNYMFGNVPLQITVKINTNRCHVKTDIIMIFWLWAQPLTTEPFLQSPKPDSIIKKKGTCLVDALSYLASWLS